MSRSSTVLLRNNFKITDFPLFKETYGKKITVVGVATRGCDIVHELSRQCKQIGNFLYVSCDEEDVVGISSGRKLVLQVSNSVERTPANIRGMVFSQLDQVKQALEGSQVVFIITGLGGSVGSGLAPLIAGCARQVHAMVVVVVSMPFNFEKSKHFFAGCALRQLTRVSDGIMLLENEVLIKEKLPLIDAHARLTESLSTFLNSLIQPIECDGSSDGVENVVDFIRSNPYSVVETSTGVSGNHGGIISESGPNALISYQSMDDATRLIDSYDPVDACIRSRQGNLDPEIDISLGFGQGILRNIED